MTRNWIRIEEEEQNCKYVATASHFVSEGEIYKMADSDKMGSYGVSMIPGSPDHPSPDNDVHVYTNNKKTQIQQVENTAHELYAHSYFYALTKKGIDINPFHSYESTPSMEYLEEYNCYEFIHIFKDTNLQLVNQIKKVTEQARNNYKKHIK